MTEPVPATTQEAAADDTPASAWPVRVKLTKPIHGKDATKIDTIEFREPTGADIVACGMPVIPDYDTGNVTFDAKAMTLMMARLSSVPLPFIQHMSTVDWATCATRLQGFFLPDLARLS